MKPIGPKIKKLIEGVAEAYVKSIHESHKGGHSTFNVDFCRRHVPVHLYMYMKREPKQHELDYCGEVAANLTSKILEQK